MKDAFRLSELLHTLCFTLLVASIAAVAVLVGYRAVIERESVSFSQGSTGVFESAHVPVFAPITPDAQEEYAQIDRERFAPDAVIRFEHHNSAGATLDAWYMDIPHALIGRTSEYLRTVFPMWSIASYDSSGALLRRQAPPAPAQVYLISSTADGFVVVFFDDEMSGPRLKEVTDIAVSGLPEVEVERLKTGVIVRGEHSLMRFLEDLGS